MASRLEAGYESVGHIEGITEDLSPAFLRLDDRGATLSMPQIVRLDGIREWLTGESAVPKNLRFADTSGTYVLGGCRRDRGSIALHGAGLQRIRAHRVIKADWSDSDTTEIDGMTSQIDGLSEWSGMTPVTPTFEHEPLALVLRAQNPDEIVLGGTPEATVDSSFSFDPRPSGNVFSITDLAMLRTRTTSPRPWREHAAVHHMFQDLMCLVYGRPCTSRITSVKRDDDQPAVGDGARSRTWSDVYEPLFGRRIEGVPPLDRGKAKPLFQLRDISVPALSKWISEWVSWSRPTWIAVTTMFQRGTTAEARLLQCGVALEALGYALWLEDGRPGRTRTPSYPQLLERVTDSVRAEHPAIYGDQPAAGWRGSFNDAFRGTKHADKPLPDGYQAHRLATQGMNLVRAWLGARLGVSGDVLVAGFDAR